MFVTFSLDEATTGVRLELKVEHCKDLPKPVVIQTPMRCCGITNIYLRMVAYKWLLGAVALQKIPKLELLWSSDTPDANNL